MDEGKDKKTYELALLLKNEDDAARMTELIRQHNGEAVSEPRAKKLALSYVIKGNTEAVFAYCTFKAAGEDVKQLERDLRMREEVIRSMIVLAPLYAEKRPISMAPSFPPQRYARPIGEPRPAAPRPLSNEALEKKIEEILQ